MQRFKIGLTAVVLALGLGLLASPAQALGTTNLPCTRWETTTGYSSTSNGGFTTNAGVCGTSKSRLFYTLYAGSITYYTSWVYSSSTAFTSNPGNIVHGGNHGVASPGLLYSNAKNYNS